MNERITLVSLFDEEDAKKIKSFIKNNNIKLWKVSFGKKLDDRIKADTLPYHFTIFSWNIKKNFKPFKLKVQSIGLFEIYPANLVKIINFN